MIRIFMGGLFSIMGMLHFIFSSRFKKVVPPTVPFKTFIAYFTGVLELLFGALLLFNKFNNTVINLINGFIWAVFPANIYMYTHHRKLGLNSPRIILLLRLPLQPLMVMVMNTLKR